jgi:TM2 domain-containing membrane protein YozV
MRRIADQMAMLGSRCDKSNPDPAIYAPHRGARMGRKGPSLALFLSLLAPGLGQLYNRQYFKGLLCMAANAITVFGSIMVLVMVTVAYSLGREATIGDFGTAAPFVPAWAWQFSNTNVGVRLLLASPLAAVSLWIWSMVDAYQTAPRDPCELRGMSARLSAGPAQSRFSAA